MNRLRALSSVLLAASALIPAGMAHADTPAQVKAQIQKLYDLDNAAASKGDFDKSLSHTSPDYVGTQPDGKKVTYADMKKMLPQIHAIMKDLHAKSTVTKIVMKGKDAVATVSEHAEAMLANPQTKKNSKLVIDDTADDLWVKSAQGWMKKSSKMLKLRQTVDGKPVPGAG